MSKSPEEIKDAVLSGFKRLCPNLGDEWCPYYRPESPSLNDFGDAARVLYLQHKSSWANGEDPYFLLCIFGQEHVITERSIENSPPCRVQFYYDLLALGASPSGQNDVQPIVDALEEARLALEHARETCQRPKRRYFSTALIKLGEALNQWNGQPAEAQK